LHIAQLMPLPLTVSCCSKIQIGFTFLVPSYMGSPEKRAVKRVCVCFGGIHHSVQFIFEYFSLCMMFCTNVVLHGHFVICICTSLVSIDAASVKHYLNAIRAKQSALNARKPLVGGREPHLCSRPFKPRAYRSTTSCSALPHTVDHRHCLVMDSKRGKLFVIKQTLSA